MCTCKCKHVDYNQNTLCLDHSVIKNNGLLLFLLQLALLSLSLSLVYKLHRDIGSHKAIVMCVVVTNT